MKTVQANCFVPHSGESHVDRLFFSFQIIQVLTYWTYANAMWLLLCRLLVVFMVLLGIIYQFIWYARDNSLSSTITKSKWAWNNAHQIKTPRGTAHYFSLFRFLCHYIERIAVFTVSMGGKLKYYITWHGITFAESRMGKMMGFNGSWEDSTLCKLHGIMAIVTAVKTQLWVFFSGFTSVWCHIKFSVNFNYDNSLTIDNTDMAIYR